MRSSDVLVMPFKNCSLIEGVDPVKMYEYLSSGHAIVSSWWQELEKFAQFPQVSLYGLEISMESAIATEVAKNKTYDFPLEFLDAHIWRKLVLEFHNEVKSLGDQL